MRPVSKLITAPAELPVSVAELKSHSRVTFTDEDTLIQIYLSSAVATVEQFLQRKLVSQTWEMYLDYWPQSIKVLFGNLQSITSVTYTDIDGTESTFSSDSYQVDTVSVPGRIMLKHGETWPSVELNATNPIKVRFVTGYGAAAAVPPDIKNAIMLLATHFYSNREMFLISKVIAMRIDEIPMTTKALLSPHRVWDWIV